MKKPPKVIYLQWYDESDGEPLDPDRGEVTWCVDRIYDTDLEYVLNDKHYKSLYDVKDKYLPNSDLEVLEGEGKKEAQNE